MIEILHDLIYIHMYYTSRIPILLVYEVYIRSFRISTINSIVDLESLNRATSFHSRCAHRQFFLQNQRVQGLNEYLAQAIYS